MTTYGRTGPSSLSLTQIWATAGPGLIRTAAARTLRKTERQPGGPGGLTRLPSGGRGMTRAWPWCGSVWLCVVLLLLPGTNPLLPLDRLEWLGLPTLTGWLLSAPASTSTSVSQQVQPPDKRERESNREQLYQHSAQTFYKLNSSVLYSAAGAGHYNIPSSNGFSSK